jgi:hypothetical protein
MRPTLLLAALVGAMAPLAGQAAGLAVNHEALPPGTTVQACVERGRQAIGASGLRQLSNTATAAWGEGFSTPGGPADTLYSVYCTPDGRYAFFVGGAERADQVNPVVTNIMNNFRATAPRAPVAAPPASSGGMRK